MTRQRLGTVLTAVAAAGFFATAAFHTTGYSSVVNAVALAPERVRVLLPMLWLAITFDFTVMGLIVAVLAYRPEGPVRSILPVVAICPFGAAGLQIRFVGFILPTAILIGVGVLTLICAIVLPSARPKPAAR